MKIKSLKNCSFCNKEVYQLVKTLCAACYYRQKKNGSLEYVKVRKKCSVDGCERLSIAQSLCQMHYSRMRKHGIIEHARFDKWGHKYHHPHRDLHYSIIRNHMVGHDPVWSDFWKFVEDVGERPTPKHTFRRKDINQPYGPDNFYWRPPLTDVGVSDKNGHSEYMRAHRSANPEWYKNFYLRRRFGIGIDWFNKTLSEQNNVCAICGKSERAINPKTGLARDLAVDHCHKTGKVRGLLCTHCNSAIGKFDDDVTLLDRAKEYILSHREDIPD